MRHSSLRKSSFHTSLRIYTAIFRASFIDASRNWGAHIGIALFLCCLVYIFLHLWKAVADSAALPFSAEQLIWYLALAEFSMMSVPRVTRTFEADMQAGRFGLALCRPKGFFRQAFVENLGTAAFRFLLLVLLGFPFCALLSGGIPFGFPVMMGALFLAALAVVVSLIQQMTLSACALWMHEATPLFWIWQKLAFVFGGLMLPLDFYPEILRTIAFATPFAAMLYGPASLVLHPHTGQFFAVALALVLWGLLSALLLSVIARSGIRHAVLTGKGI